jgi:uncharacterized protein (TIGR00304 family)
MQTRVILPATESSFKGLPHLATKGIMESDRPSRLVNRLRLVSLVLALAGLAALAKAWMEGGANVAFFLIFPIVYRTSGWATLGMLLLMAAFVTFAFSGLTAGIPSRGEYDDYRTVEVREPSYEGARREERRQDRGEPEWGGPGWQEPQRRGEGAARDEPRTRAKGGGVVLIGPFPIVFGNDPGALKWLVGLTILLMLLMFAFLLLGPALLRPGLSAGG